MKEFHRGDFANRTGLAQAWTVKSADRLFTTQAKTIVFFFSIKKDTRNLQGVGGGEGSQRGTAVTTA